MLKGARVPEGGLAAVPSADTTAFSDQPLTASVVSVHRFPVGISPLSTGPGTTLGQSAHLWEISLLSLLTCSMGQVNPNGDPSAN